jgi:hypothetical protein
MQFRIIESGLVISEYEFRALFANVSFPVDISEETAVEFGANTVQSVVQPVPTLLQTVQDTGAQQGADGAWFQTWALQDLTDPEQIAAIVLAEEKRQIAEFTQAVQAYLNEAAQAKGYDDIRSAALRAGYPGPFHAEGVLFAGWMDDCWAACYAILADVKAGSTVKPSAPELLTQLPALPSALVN